MELTSMGQPHNMGTTAKHTLHSIRRTSSTLLTQINQFSSGQSQSWHPPSSPLSKKHSLGTTQLSRKPLRQLNRPENSCQCNSNSKINSRHFRQLIKQMHKILSGIPSNQVQSGWTCSPVATMNFNKRHQYHSNLKTGLRRIWWKNLTSENLIHSCHHLRKLSLSSPK